jgi:hypothetical protein
MALTRETRASVPSIAMSVVLLDDELDDELDEEGDDALLVATLITAVEKSAASAVSPPGIV